MEVDADVLLGTETVVYHQNSIENWPHIIDQIMENYQYDGTVCFIYVQVAPRYSDE